MFAFVTLDSCIVDAIWPLKTWNNGVRKNAPHKESLEEKFHVQEQSLMAGWPGKDGAEQTLAKAWLL
jgi:hypothetical protein